MVKNISSQHDKTTASEEILAPAQSLNLYKALNMGKCQPCSDWKCEGKYENRGRCDDRQNCSCTCQELADDTTLKATSSIVGGVAAVAGGVALTVMTGGLAAVFGGAALVGAGSSMVINPLAKKASGERMTGKDYLTDVAVGTVIGAASGGIGAGGSVLTKGASGVAKFTVRAGAGVVSGAAGGAISETGRAIKGEEVDASSVVKSVGVGALCGGLGGASSHVASNASKVVSGEVTKAAVRVGTQTGAGAAVDAVIQKVETGKVDIGKVAANAAGQAMIATTAETGRYAAERTHQHHDKVTGERIKEDFKDPRDVKKVQEMLEKANEIPREDLKELKKSSKQAEYAKKQFNKLSSEKTRLEAEIKMNNQKFQAAKNDPSVPRKDLGQIQKDKIPVIDEINKVGKKIDQINKNMPKTTLPDKNHFHFMQGDRKGQASMYFDSDVNPNFGKERILLEQDDNLSRKTHKRFTYSDRVKDHDYGAARKPKNLRPAYDPHEAARPETFLSGKQDEEEQNDKKAK